MDRNRRIAQHRFGPCRRDRYLGRFARLRVDHWVMEIPEIARHGLMKNLVVTDGGMQKCIPVDQSFAPIDQLIFEHVEKRMPNRPSANRVERKPCPLPIATAPHLLELAKNPPLV